MKTQISRKIKASLQSFYRSHHQSLMKFNININPNDLLPKLIKIFMRKNNYLAKWKLLQNKSFVIHICELYNKVIT